jgi:hypothetical protein
LWSVTIVFNFLGAFTKLQKGAISFVMTVSQSVHLYAWNNSAPTQRIYMKIDIEYFSNICRDNLIFIRI